MTTGIWVLNVFAAIWAAIGLLSAGFPAWAITVPVAISATIGSLSVSVAATLLERSSDTESRVGRVVGIWSAVEGVAIAVTVNVLLNVGLSEFVVPAVGIIVGLHFFPLARGIPVPVYYATGSALVVLSVAAMLLPPVYMAPVTALGASVILWTSSAVVVALA